MSIIRITVHKCLKIGTHINHINNEIGKTQDKRTPVCDLMFIFNTHARNVALIAPLLGLYHTNAYSTQVW